jgi:hypothetical protein
MRRIALITASLIYVLVVFSALGAAAPDVEAQVPSVISVALYLEEAGIPVNGRRTLDVSWFDMAVGGVPLHTEAMSADVVNGVATLFLGSVVPLPSDLLLKGPFWLGIRIDGGAELSPRTMLASVPYAMMADRARIAQEIAPEVTGVVTSVNEMAGAIQVEAGPGIGLQRIGSALRLTSTSVVETGTVDGNVTETEYTIRPATTLTSRHMIHAEVRAASHIGIRVTSVDLAANTFTLAAAAPLTDSETIVWSVLQ